MGTILDLIQNMNTTHLVLSRKFRNGAMPKMPSMPGVCSTIAIIAISNRPAWLGEAHAESEVFKKMKYEKPGIANHFNGSVSFRSIPHL